MARDKAKSKKEAKGENDTLLQRVLTKIDRLSDKVDSIGERIDNIDIKLERLRDIEEEVYYTANRFRFEPFLCDPEIREGDLVLVKVKENSQQVERHRIVKRVREDTITIVQEGEEVKVDKKKVGKVGHSPTLKYLALQDIEEDSKLSKQKFNNSIDSKLDNIGLKVGVIQKLKEDVQFLKETAITLSNIDDKESTRKREANETKKGTKKTRR